MAGSLREQGLEQGLWKDGVDDPGMDPFTALDRDWDALATGPPARRAMSVWAEGLPSLAGYESPAHLVADIARLGNPEQSCRLLAHLLLLARANALAARAVLQAVTPGLRAAAGRRWRTASGNGPWPSYDDIAADTISAAWEAIRSHAGQRHDRPARIIVRFAKGRLRRAHERWRATYRHLAELTDETERTQSAIDAALDAEQQALNIITDALQAGIIDPKEASILIAIAVHGQSVTEAERILRWAPKSGYRVLDRARRGLRQEATNTDPHGPRQPPGHTGGVLTVELPSHSMTPLVSPDLCALLATLIRRRADLTRPGAAA